MWFYIWVYIHLLVCIWVYIWVCIPDQFAFGFTSIKASLIFHHLLSSSSKTSSPFSTFTPSTTHLHLHRCIHRLNGFVTVDQFWDYLRCKATKPRSEGGPNTGGPSRTHPTWIPLLVGAPYVTTTKDLFPYPAAGKS